MAVFLTILKIIGIVLLVILLLILAVLLLILLVPIRYDAAAAYHGEVKGKVKVTWLLRAISLQLFAKKDQMRYQLKIFGIPLVSNGKKKKVEKEPVKAEASVAESPETKGDESANDAPGGKTLVSLEERLPADLDKVVQAELRNEEAAGNQTQGSLAGSDAPMEAGESVEEAPVGQSRISLVEPAQADLGKVKKEKKERRGLAVRIAAILDRLVELYAKAADKLEDFKCTFESLCDTLFSKREWLEDQIELVTSRSTKRAVRKVFRELKILLKKLLPQEWDLSMDLGFEDISTTGKVMAITSMIDPVFPGNLSLVPYYYEEKTEGETRLKGKIRLGSFALMALRLVLCRDIWKTYRAFRKK